MIDWLINSLIEMAIQSLNQWMKDKKADFVWKRVKEGEMIIINQSINQPTSSNQSVMQAWRITIKKRR